MRPIRTMASAAVLLLTTPASLTGTAAPAAAAASAVPNGSFEGGWRGGKLACWALSDDLGRLTLTRTGHRGVAAYAEGGGRPGKQVSLTSDPTKACRIGVSEGGHYRLRFWLRSTKGAGPLVSTYSPRDGWKPWFTGGRIAAAALRQHSITLPTVPAGVTAVRVGVRFDAAGTVVLDDVTMQARAGQLLFRPSFPAQNGLVTNDYAYWSPTDPRRAASRVWDMTSGSLFARDGHGYSGVPDDKPTDALSRLGTRSAIFRLTTRDYSFGNVSVRTTLKVHRLSSTRSTPAVKWDGVHLFLRYKSQYRLYYASVARRDGTVVIKKKCPGGRSNAGTYYELSAEKPGYPIPFGAWRAVGATVRDSSDGSVVITVSIGGKSAAKVTDRGRGCAPIIGTGAVGVRGDNAEFEFDRYRVSALG